MLVRDAASSGIEVLLLRRHPDSAFVPDAHVFPGGAVDADDASPSVDAVATGLDDDRASRRLGLASGGLAYWVAAVRETFEEAGLLLAAATDDGGDPWSDPARAARLRAARREVDAGRLPFGELCRAEGLRLDLGQLRSFGRWITPLGAPRRYDTRFFVAPAPPGQPVTVDDREAVDAEWARPADALDRFARREIDLILPTERSLRALADHDDTAALLAWLDTEPVEVDDHGGWRVAAPSDDVGPSPSAPPRAAPLPVGEP
jgi:8-oxo-dGTP pyrophosphatase MutT (NUDIX family)